MHRASLALANLVFLGAAVSQSYTAHPIDNFASGTSQNIPIAGNSASWDEARSHFFFPAAFLPSAGGLLMGIELAANITGTTPYERFEIWADLTQNPGLSTTFANNLTAPILVYSQTPGSISWTGNAWTPLVFQQPFPYDGQSNLVLEVRKQINRISNPPTSSISHRALVWPRRTDLPPPIWAYGAYGSGAVDASVAQTTYSTQILMRLQWLGTPSLTIDSSRDVTGNTARSYFHSGATWTTRTQGLPNDFYAAAIDTVLNPVGLPVPVVFGGLWLSSPILYNSGFLDGSGQATHSFLIPSNPGFVGLRFYLQNATLGGMSSMTNVVDAPIAAY